MIPISPVLPGSKEFEVVLAKDQPEYIPLPALVLEDPYRRYVTRWQFTDEEREWISEGADLIYCQNTFDNPFHPMSFQLIRPISKEEDDAASVSKTLASQEATSSGEGDEGRPGDLPVEHEGGPGRVREAEGSDVGAPGEAMLPMLEETRKRADDV